MNGSVAAVNFGDVVGDFFPPSVDVELQVFLLYLILIFSWKKSLNPFPNVKCQNSNCEFAHNKLNALLFAISILNLNVAIIS